MEAHCSYLKVEESFVHFFQAVVDIGFNSKDLLTSMEYFHRAALAHDRLGRYAAVLQICSHLFDWSRTHRLVLAGDRYYSDSVGNCFYHL